MSWFLKQNDDETEKEGEEKMKIIFAYTFESEIVEEVMTYH